MAELKELRTAEVWVMMMGCWTVHSLELQTEE